MSHSLLVNIFGILLIVTGIFDAGKYAIQGRKIQQARSAKNFSRKFINFALGNNIIKLLYGVVICDFYIIFTSFLALTTIMYMWYQIYVYYPYRCRKLRNFKRPSLWKYFINSLQSNQTRKRL